MYAADPVLSQAAEQLIQQAQHQLEVALVDFSAQLLQQQQQQLQS